MGDLDIKDVAYSCLHGTAPDGVGDVRCVRCEDVHEEYGVRRCVCEGGLCILSEHTFKGLHATEHLLCK